MTLFEQLAAADAAGRGTLTAEQIRILDYAPRWLSQSGIEAGALRSGELAPDFALSAAGAPIVRLGELLDRGPAVVVFFCGDWCPLCATVLAAYAGIAPELAVAGGSMVAIAPQMHDPDRPPPRGPRSLPLRLDDPGGKVCRLFGLRYVLPASLEAVYRARGIDVAACNGGHGAFLPIPAIYVIDRTGMVAAAVVTPDHLRHAEPGAIVAAVRALAVGEG